MTGESDDVEINHNKNPFLVSGTKVADGYGQMLVTSVGMNTTWGEMMCHINRETDEQTPLQARLNKLSSWIGKVGLTVSFLVLVVLMVTSLGILKIRVGIRNSMVARPRLMI
ncbi:CALCIUM-TRANSPORTING ATPASE [Salix koriyanagi]|uniref:CALCIUM-TRANSPORTING ATPASE n=1 Tax=Salix koriyanagi TaxID=2511006 RepID=A0A9Q0WRD8_9ROSI|nr:CALCIUM-TRANSPORTING ATPASE [Salix koriyanagi]